MTLEGQFFMQKRLICRLLIGILIILLVLTIVALYQRRVSSGYLPMIVIRNFDRLPVWSKSQQSFYFISNADYELFGRSKILLAHGISKYDIVSRTITRYPISPPLYTGVFDISPDNNQIVCNLFNIEKENAHISIVNLLNNKTKTISNIDVTTLYRSLRYYWVTNNIIIIQTGKTCYVYNINKGKLQLLPINAETVIPANEKIAQFIYSANSKAYIYDIDENELSPINIPINTELVSYNKDDKLIYRKWEDTVKYYVYNIKKHESMNWKTIIHNSTLFEEQVFSPDLKYNVILYTHPHRPNVLKIYKIPNQ